MNAFRHLLLFLTLQAACATAQETLPADTKALADKLAAFSQQERSEAEARIKEKEQSVIKILEGHKDRETKAGNLDAAVAIKTLIESLEKGAPATTAKSEPVGEGEAAGMPFVDWLRKVRLVQDDNDREFTFSANEVFWSYPSKPDFLHRRPLKIDVEARTLSWQSDKANPQSPIFHIEMKPSLKTGRYFEDGKERDGIVAKLPRD